MGEWKEYQLDELASVTGGKRLPLGAFLTDMPTGHPYIRTRDLAGNKVDVNALQFVPDDVFPHIKQYIVTAGDIIVSVVGTIGLCAMIPEELHNASLTENCNRISAFKTSLVSPEYLFFYLTGSVGQDELRQRTVGSTQPKLPMYNLREMPILLPPVVEQRAIASVLSSLDAKIDLLHRQNKTLEAMAEALFRQWFVEEAEEGWEERTVADLADVTSGKRPLERFAFPTSDARVPVWGGNGPMAYTREALVDSDVLLTGRVGTLGSIFRINTPIWPSDNTLLLTARRPEAKEFLFQQLRSIDFAQLNRGSTQPLLTQSDLKAQSFPMPPDELLLRYHEISRDLYARVDANLKAVQTLTTLRDTLLPKLMSGEVRVDEQ
ncbi:MAG: restriction endonuclease subunit S [Flavobacteriales bacterium]|nr:restriction endonuclease subunit S [Flavobacteriales bacterium]